MNPFLFSACWCYINIMVVLLLWKLARDSTDTPPTKLNQLIDQFSVGFHPYIIDIVDVKGDNHCRYHIVVALLGLGEDSGVVVRMNLHKKNLVNRSRNILICLKGMHDMNIKKKLISCLSHDNCNDFNSCYFLS